MGAQRKQQVGGLGEIKYEWNPMDVPGSGRHQRIKLDLDADNTLTRKPGSSVRTHAYDASVGYLFYLKPHVYLVGIAEGYHNSSLQLYLQQSYGGGIGASRDFAGQRQTIEVTADLRGITEHFLGVNTPAITFAGIRVGEAYTIRLGDPSKNPPQLSISARYIPALNQRGAWQARGRAHLIVPIGKSFSITLSVTDD